MDCKEVKEALYDFLTHRLKDDDLQKVDAHITQCENCKKNLEELKGTLNLLDTWKTPELSPGFRARVLESIEERESRKPAAVVKRMLGWILQPPHLKRPLQGLAVVAMILLAFTAYRGLSPGPDRTMRDLPSPVKVTGAENPIVVEVKDVDEALDGLKKMIEIHHGSLVRRRPVEGTMEITFSLEGAQEEKLIGDLGQLGTVHRIKPGFKDGDGNIVVLLKKR
jgi:anti-sigma factor RsiW